MKPILICLAAVIALLAAVLLYRSVTASNRLDVDPQASREIDKAKHH